VTVCLKTTRAANRVIQTTRSSTHNPRVTFTFTRQTRAQWPIARLGVTRPHHTHLLHSSSQRVKVNPDSAPLSTESTFPAGHGRCASLFMLFHEEHVMTTLDPQGPAAACEQGANVVGAGMGDGPGPDVMAASTLDGNKVMSSDGEHVGKISAIMLDVRGGRIAYAVLSSGGFLGMGDSLHAIPWSALTLDTDDKCFLLDASAERIRTAPSFDKDNWPSMADMQWGRSVHAHYNRSPYWSATRDVVEERESDSNF
jgi:sporulation protein YlmC with PRC-barrel domain